MPTRRTFDKAEFLPNDNSTPHIVPDVLYPAIGGKLLDGTTSHSGDYGTAQSSDSRKYYYTDIKGSGPIRDPRIGAHFGSQRHKFKSIQLLERETATHGSNVYSVDGREWIRAYGDWVFFNNSAGVGIYTDGGTSNHGYLEITGYFSDVNMIGVTFTSNRGYVYAIDGASYSAEQTTFETSVNTPLGSRFVDYFSLANVVAGQTLGIHTISFRSHAVGDYFEVGGCELIAQDTTNAVTRNKIQIPSQTVFSFGSKFTVGGSSTARHYDPFSAKSDGTGWTSPTSGTNTPNSSAAWPSNIDTATSLGLAKWVDGTNYYRPYNGGRVVNWVDENGEIKTSVTVMPPNAKSVANSGTLTNGTAKANGSAPNDNFRPTFETHSSNADEDFLSEIAKSIHFREFGNGAANGGTGATYADASMIDSTADDIAYVMDDGLTSLQANNGVIQNDVLGVNGSSDSESYLTFIGTGLGYHAPSASGSYNSLNNDIVAQNLPYGTHVVRNGRNSGSALNNVDVDGIEVHDDNSAIQGLEYINIYQPKMPPIPEGACIIADYMLMADFVPATSIDGSISKGVRYCNGGRDIFYDSGGAITYNQTYNYLGYQITSLYNNNATSEARFTAFGTAYACHYVRGTNREANLQARLDGTNYTYVEGDVFDTSGEWDDSNDDGTLTKDGGSEAFHLFGIKNQTLGIHTFGDKKSSGTDYNAWSAFDVATPIHTSHHYKSFETPFLHELIGGDRNMEQTHLICSADGKTWDEVTRDTSYIGNKVVHCSLSSTVTSMQEIKFDEWRGSAAGNEVGTALMNKDFAIAYDRIICLRDGEYTISASEYINASAAEGRREIKVNGSIAASMYTVALNTNNVVLNPTLHLKRGDYVQYRGCFYGNYGQFSIVRVR